MRKLLAFLLLSASAFATTTVTGNLKDLSTGLVAQNTYVRVYLRGCGGNTPRVNGTALIVPVNGAVYLKDFKPDATGAISGTLYSTRDSAGTGNGDIECGGSLTAVWYGVRVVANGVEGPEMPVHAKSGATLDLTNVTPISTTPVVTAPTGDSTYARLDGGNMPFTGALSASSATISGALNKMCFANGTSSDGGIATCLATFGAAPACGTIFLPRGITSISATMDFTNREGCVIRGQGNGQAASSATTAIKWTGTSGATVLTVSSTRWSTFQDFTIDGNSLAGRAIDFTAVNAVGASQKVTFQRITILGVTQSPSQNVHVGSSTNDQVSESALTDITHLNCITCVFQEGTQTANIRYVGGMFEGYTTIGLDLEGGSSTTVQGVDFEDTVTTGTSVKGADLAALTNITFIENYFEELATTNVAFSFPSGAGARHAPTTIIGGRILFPTTATTQVVFDFEEHANLVMVGTMFTSNAPGQGGIIKMSAVGGTPNINSFHQVTLQNSWTIAALGSNSSLVLDNATATVSNVSTIQTRGSGLELWSGAIQLDDASGVGKYRILTNSNEYRLTDTSGNILSLEQGQNGHFMTEATCGAGRAGLDELCADPTSHRYLVDNNNTGKTYVGDTIMQDCGATSTCSATNLKKPQIVKGNVALSGGTVTVTGISPAFTSSISFECTSYDATTVANANKCVGASASTIACTGTGTDVIHYVCAGN